MDKIELNPNDLLHICIPTEQNVINLYSFEYLVSRQKLYQGTGIIYHLLITSAYAGLKGWHEKLISIFGYHYCKVLEFSESESYESKLRTIRDFIDANYSVLPAVEVYINYGGGLKQFTPVIWSLKDRFKKAILMYPDKGLNRMTLTEFSGGISVGETIEKLKLSIDVDQYLSLFLSRKDTIEKSEVFKMKHFEDESKESKNDHFTQALLHLPYLYDDQNLTDFLYVVSSGLDTGSIDLSFIDMITHLRSNDEYRVKVEENIRNNFTFGEYKIDADFKLDYPYGIPNLKDLLNNLKKQFWNLKNYVTDHTLVLKQEHLQAFKNKGVHPVTDGDKSTLIQKVFNTGYLKDLEIDSHSSYFELICLKQTLLWASKYPELVHEIAYNVKITKTKPFGKGTQDYIQIDIMIYTNSGTIYFIECKTFKFESEDFIAAIKKIENLGGLFNYYFIVLPPLPSENEHNIRKRFESIFEQYAIMTAGYRNVACCQLSGSGDDSLFPLLEHKLDIIVQNELK